jgi:hypothetical protein
MGTKKSGWPSTWIFRARFLAFTLSVASLVAATSAGCAHRIDQRQARQRIVDFNWQALASYERKDFEAAEGALTKALKLAKEANLEDDKLTARTYLHLGVVYLAGYQDRTSALQNFVLARKIRPNIQMTPTIETPELKAIFDQAKFGFTFGPTPEAAENSEPDLPTTLFAPLACTTPDASPSGEALPIRCAVGPGVSAKSVWMHYRALGAETFQPMPMRRTPKGWYRAIIPGHVMIGPGIQVYYDARDATDEEVATNGQFDSPSVIEIREKSAFPEIDDVCPDDFHNDVADTGSLDRKRNRRSRP